MGKFFDILSNSMNLNSGGSGRVADRRGRPERPKTYITPNKSRVIERSWSVSSSIVALPVSTPGPTGPPTSRSEPNVHRLQQRKPVSNVTYRRGQSQSSSTKTPSGGLRGASSVSSLDSKPRPPPPKPKGPKVERLARRDGWKNDADVGVSNNNKPLAQVSATVSGSGSADTAAALQQLDAVSRELDAMARDKQALALELQAHQHELLALRGEVARLKKASPPLALAHSPLSDSEKQQLLASQRASSAPASMHASPEQPGAPGEEVACLQDRIMQMQETHYSTNEELQATLQELADLQLQLSELQAENERLAEEKAVLLESLMRQTDRLEDSRSELDSLKQLLCQDQDQDQPQPEELSRREAKLLELLKTAQEEREVLQLKEAALEAELEEARGAAERGAERARLLQAALEAAQAERRELERELAQHREHAHARGIELSRLNTLLEHARAKIEELEQDRALSDKSELDELLDNARKEKDSLESQVASLQEQLSLCQCEIARLKDQILTLQEECKVTRNNAVCTQSELSYTCSQLQAETSRLGGELQALDEACREQQRQAQAHLEDKRQLAARLSAAQRHLGDAEARRAAAEELLALEKQSRQQENAEWEQFQNDLLMTVRVANDFKTEAQQELQTLVLDNKVQKDRVRQLEKELEKLKALQAKSQPSMDSSQAVLTSFQQEMSVRRQKTALSRQDSRLSVKSLIESIENATKQPKVGPDSRSSSSSSLNSLSGDTRKPVSPLRADWPEVIPTKAPLRDRDTRKNVITDGFAKLEGKPAKDEFSFLPGKALDFSRRNSYCDLSERKDPLNALVKNGGSKRNALLKWCQSKTGGYRNIDITNFSSSWTDGLALCALLHSYLPARVPYERLQPSDQRANFSVAFAAAESVGIHTTLNINDMIQLERPDWQQVMAYVTAIYKHFET